MFVLKEMLLYNFVFFFKFSNTLKSTTLGILWDERKKIWKKNLQREWVVSVIFWDGILFYIACFHWMFLFASIAISEKDCFHKSELPIRKHWFLVSCVWNRNMFFLNESDVCHLIWNSGRWLLNEVINSMYDVKTSLKYGKLS